VGLRAETTGHADAKWCRAQADECESLARLVSLRTDKEQLHDKARGWREMADQADERLRDA